MKCTIKGCDKPHNAKGYCMSHYMKFKRYGDPLGGRIETPTSCNIMNCKNPHNALGYCLPHYNYHRNSTIRSKLLYLLGNKCVVCGTCKKDTLQFDHIHGGGRKDYGNSPRTRYLYYINNPEITKDTLQILCVRCNYLKRMKNVIPHKARMTIIKHLGATCGSCCITDINLLQLDHIKNDGAKDRARFGGSVNMHEYYKTHLDEAKTKLQVLCVT